MNLPPGVSVNDPNAPWNFSAVVFSEWKREGVGTCDCCEAIDTDVDEDSLCELCFVSEEEEVDEDCHEDFDYLEDYF